VKLEILLIIGVVAAGYFLLKRNTENGKRFVRAHHFLMQIDTGASVDTANRAAQYLLGKGSDADGNHRAIMRAKAFANENYNGKQLPVISAAISRGFRGASLNRYEMSAAKNSEIPRLGREAGALAIQQLSLPFLLSGSHRDGTFYPPDGFFDDPFVSGYIMSFINTFRANQLNDSELSNDDRNKFIQAALEAADPRLTNANLSDSWVGSLRSKQGDKNVSDGANAATAIVLAMVGKIDEDHPSPLIASARELAKVRSGMASEIQDLMPDQGRQVSSASAALVSSIHEVTVGQYMRQRYPELCGP
jgi:hypothetical protein